MIYLTKSSTKKSPKIGSQILDANPKSKEHYREKKNKNIFNNAIDTIRDNRKRKHSNSKEENRGKQEEETIRTVKIGEKNIIIKRKVKRERSREKIINVTNKYDLQMDNNMGNRRYNKERFNKGGYNNNHPNYRNQNTNNYNFRNKFQQHPLKKKKHFEEKKGTIKFQRRKSRKNWKFR